MSEVRHTESIIEIQTVSVPVPPMIRGVPVSDLLAAAERALTARSSLAASGVRAPLSTPGKLCTFTPADVAALCALNPRDMLSGLVRTGLYVPDRSAFESVVQNFITNVRRAPATTIDATRNLVCSAAEAHRETLRSTLFAIASDSLSVIGFKVVDVRPERGFLLGRDAEGRDFRVDLAAGNDGGPGLRTETFGFAGRDCRVPHARFEEALRSRGVVFRAGAQRPKSDPPVPRRRAAAAIESTH